MNYWTFEILVVKIICFNKSRSKFQYSVSNHLINRSFIIDNTLPPSIGWVYIQMYLYRGLLGVKFHDTKQVVMTTPSLILPKLSKSLEIANKWNWRFRKTLQKKRFPMNITKIFSTLSTKIVYFFYFQLMYYTFLLSGVSSSSSHMHA